ncbi:hypothetical protein ASG01_00140 [Chryseobacterium sp. Leaf180]|nr:hypothetical protein ASG01_00140 [Chryseobacterium sp. Leaf180]
MIWAALSAVRSRFLFRFAPQKELHSGRAAGDSPQQENPKDSISIAVGEIEEQDSAKPNLWNRKHTKGEPLKGFN